MIKKLQVQLIVYDFDGVMTDNRVLFFDNGREAVFCNRSDGLAVQEIKQLGIPQIILSTEVNQILKSRAKKIGLSVINSRGDKKRVLIRYCKKKKCDLKKVLYVGNDINDLEAMKVVGYPVCPIDAYYEIKKIAKIILKVKGGRGVVRNLLKYISIRG